jgi:hypothetical protein
MYNFTNSSRLHDTYITDVAISFVHRGQDNVPRKPTFSSLKTVQECDYLIYCSCCNRQQYHGGSSEVVKFYHNHRYLLGCYLLHEIFPFSLILCSYTSYSVIPVIP